MEKNYLVENGNLCQCLFCGEKIKKGEKHIEIIKSAWKGYTRSNICKDCLVKIVVRFGVDNQEINKIRKEIILENL